MGDGREEEDAPSSAHVLRDPSQRPTDDGLSVTLRFDSDELSKAIQDGTFECHN